MDKGIHIDQDTLAIYALGALEPREDRLVRTHLEICDECQANLRAYGAIVDGLLHTAQPVEPPVQLRARLLAATAESQKHQQGSFWQKFRSLPLAPMALGLSALLLALNIGLWVQIRDVRLIEQQLLRQLGEDRIAQGLFAYPDVHRVQIEGEEVYGAAIYEEYLQFAVLYVWGLEPLPEGQVYQAWLIEPDGGRLNGGLFTVEENAEFVQVVVQAPEMLDSFDGIGVTIEPAGGSLGPTGQKVLGVDL